MKFKLTVLASHGAEINAKEHRNTYVPCGVALGLAEAMGMILARG